MKNNRIKLIGNVGQRIHYMVTERGISRLSFTLASSVNRLSSGYAGIEKANVDWHYIVVWGEDAGLLRDQLSPGDFVKVAGTLRYENYSDKDGNMRRNTVIVADMVVPVTLDSDDEE